MKQVAALYRKAHGNCAMPELPRSPLDDPATAAHAWARYRRLMRFMLAITLVMVGAAFFAVYQKDEVQSAHMYVATALMVGFAMLLMSALMGLVFLSSGTGHDEAVNHPGGEDTDQSAG
jgi:peptidoglycan/LPS O-acetylase OafA/YrhL